MQWQILLIAVHNTVSCLNVTVYFLVIVTIYVYCLNKDLRRTTKQFLEACEHSLIWSTWIKGFSMLEVITPYSLLFHPKRVLFWKPCAALFSLPVKPHFSFLDHFLEPVLYNTKKEVPHKADTQVFGTLYFSLFMNNNCNHSLKYNQNKQGQIGANTYQ